MAKHRTQTPNAPAPGGAYSQALRVGDFVFTAGVGLWHPVTRLVVGESIEEQTTQILEKIKAILEAAGVGMGDSVRWRVSLNCVRPIQQRP